MKRIHNRFVIAVLGIIGVLVLAVGTYLVLGRDRQETTENTDGSSETSEETNQNGESGSQAGAPVQTQPVTGGTKPSADTSWSTYESRKYGIAFRYPNALWRMEEPVGNIGEPTLRSIGTSVFDSATVVFSRSNVTCDHSSEYRDPDGMTAKAGDVVFQHIYDKPTFDPASEKYEASSTYFHTKDGWCYMVSLNVQKTRQGSWSAGQGTAFENAIRTYDTRMKEIIQTLTII